jgi:hypothetical protein
MEHSIVFTPEQEVGLRLSLDPNYQNIPTPQLYGLVSGRLEGLTEEQAEWFWNTISKIGRGALEIGKRILPGVASGAATGSFAGPWGTAIGGLIGGLGSLFSGQRQQPPSPRPPIQGGIPIPAPAVIPQVPPTGAEIPSSPLQGKASPTAQLLQLIQNPAVQQALTSVIMGPAGNKTIPVAGIPVSTGDFLNLLNVLTASASKEAAENYGSNIDESYHHLLGTDPANPEHRAEALIELLRRQEALTKMESYHHESESLFSGLTEGAPLRVFLR